MEKQIYVYDIYACELIATGTIDELLDKYKSLNRRRIELCLENDYRYGSLLYFSYRPFHTFSIRDFMKLRSHSMC